MKIAAYIFATLNFFTWSSLTCLGAYFLISWHKENGYQPTIGDVVTGVLLPVAVVAVVIWSFAILRRRTDAFFGTNCILTLITIAAGPMFVAQFGTGV